MDVELRTGPKDVLDAAESLLFEDEPRHNLAFGIVSARRVALHRAPVPWPGHGSPRRAPRERAMAVGGVPHVVGQEIVVNLPTEEVFTTPDRTQTEGTVRLPSPLYWHGSSVEGGWLRSVGGEVVEVGATVGEEFLRTMLATDDGSSRLGEVALVDVDSAVGQRGLAFRNLILDEN